MRMRRLEVIATLALVCAVAALYVSLGGADKTSLAGPATSNGLASMMQQAGEIPTTFSYQGFIRNPDGSLHNGTPNIAVRVYNAPTGGTPLHEETFASTPVRDGMFNVVLGDSGQALPNDLLTAHPGLYVGVTVGTDAELIPRQRIHAQPWSMRAKSADVAMTLPDNTSLTGLSLQGTTSLAGNLRIDNEPPIIVKRWDHVPVENYGEHNTGLSVLTHTCVVGGRHWVYDINEGANWRWTYATFGKPETNTWWVQYSAAMQNDGDVNRADATIEVVCFRNEIAKFELIDAGLQVPQNEDPAFEAAQDQDEPVR